MAKNFGLYGQRVGTFSVPNEDEVWVSKLNNYLNGLIRKIYSTNPRYGSDLAKIVLSTPELRA